MDGEESEDDAFYVFTTSTHEALETLELRINDKVVNVVVDSGVTAISCQSMCFILYQGGKYP